MATGLSAFHVSYDGTTYYPVGAVQGDNVTIDPGAEVVGVTTGDFALNRSMVTSGADLSGYLTGDSLRLLDTVGFRNIANALSTFYANYGYIGGSTELLTGCKLNSWTMSAEGTDPMVRFSTSIVGMERDTGLSQSAIACGDIIGMGDFTVTVDGTDYKCAGFEVGLNNGIVPVQYANKSGVTVANGRYWPGLLREATPQWTCRITLDDYVDEDPWDAVAAHDVVFTFNFADGKLSETYAGNITFSDTVINALQKPMTSDSFFWQYDMIVAPYAASMSLTVT